jgi:putative alpha-1,2-mannosidase
MKVDVISSLDLVTARWNKLRAVALKVALMIVVATAAMDAPAQVEYVDPTIGNVGVLLVHTRPAVYMPNSMIRVYPIRSDAMDDQIESFPLTINSHRIQELFSLMPGDDGKPAAWDQEKTTPYYYSVLLGDSRIQTEFSATERAGYFRMTYSPGQAPAVVLANRAAGKLHAEGNAVSGEERFNGMAAYVYGEFREPIQTKAETIEDKSRLTISSAGSKVMEFRYGISFISVEQARKNLAHEIPDWDLIESRMQERKDGTRRWAKSR